MHTKGTFLTEVRHLARKEVSDDFKIFSKRLSELMKERHITQDALATALGVKRQTVSLYKSGQSMPDAEQLKNIAKFFDVSSDWLLGLSEAKELSGELSQVCNYVGLNSEAVRTLKELCEHKSDQFVLNFILKNEMFLANMIGYLSASAWENVNQEILAYRSPRKEEVERYDRAVDNGMFGGMVRKISASMPIPVVKPDSEIYERYLFAQAIKDMSKMYEDFKKEHEKAPDFLKDLVSDFLEGYDESD